MPSYEKINYLLRPNKSVERKMVCEMLSTISTIRDISSYQYIGFGSTYFADFSLFHRNLGISKMISIEEEDSAQDRCEFNKPFACIKLKMGKSSNLLSNLNINTNDSIVWLDYDGIISKTVFSDINTVVGMMKPDSFFMLSLNADLNTLKDDESAKENEDKPNLIQILISKIGEDRFPNQYSEKKLTSKMYLQILYQCIMQEIYTVVQKRNGMEENKVKFHQSIHFEYRDGARMLTLGGFLFNENEEEKQLKEMGIQRLPFYRNDSSICPIRCPILSLREIQALNAHLPCKEMDNTKGIFEDEELNSFPITNSDINQYSKLYRYFPNFAETLL